MPGFVAPDLGGQRRTAEALHVLVCDRLKAGYEQAGVNVPRELKKNSLTPQLSR